MPIGGDLLGSPPVPVIVASFSRVITAEMLPYRMTADLLSGSGWLLAGQLGACPTAAALGQRGSIGRAGISPRASPRAWGRL